MKNVTTVDCHNVGTVDGPCPSCNSLNMNEQKQGEKDMENTTNYDKAMPDEPTNVAQQGEDIFDKGNDEGNHSTWGLDLLADESDLRYLMIDMEEVAKRSQLLFMNAGLILKVLNRSDDPREAEVLERDLVHRASAISNEMADRALDQRGVGKDGWLAGMVRYACYARVAATRAKCLSDFILAEEAGDMTDEPVKMGGFAGIASEIHDVADYCGDMSVGAHRAGRQLYREDGTAGEMKELPDYDGSLPQLKDDIEYIGAALGVMEELVQMLRSENVVCDILQEGSRPNTNKDDPLGTTDVRVDLLKDDTENRCESEGPSKVGPVLRDMKK